MTDITAEELEGIGPDNDRVSGGAGKQDNSTQGDTMGSRAASESPNIAGVKERLAEAAKDAELFDDEASDLDCIYADALRVIEGLEIQNAWDCAQRKEAQVEIAAFKEMEAELVRAEKRAQAEIERLRGLVFELADIAKSAIVRGDWRVDGACDPYRVLDRARAALGEKG